MTKESAPFGRISRSTYLGEPGFDNYTENQWHIGYQLQHRFGEGLQFRQNVRYADSDQEILAMRAQGVLGDERTISRSVNSVLADFQGIAIDNQVQADFVTGALRHKFLAGLDYQHINSAADFRVAPGSTIDAYHPDYGAAPILDPFQGR